jgi:hypothetical protein
MSRITTLFWDIGGVILTNGWDRGSRKEAADTFDLDWEEFQDRHELSFPAFDAGQISINEYLDRTLFYRPRKFTREEFTAFMFAQSKEYPGSRAILDACARTGRYFIGAINNEPLELNQYRIEAFNLRKSFQVFSVPVTSIRANQKKAFSAWRLPSLSGHPKNAFSLMIASSISKVRDASVLPSFTISRQTNCEPTCEIFRLRYSFRVVTRHVSAGSSRRMHGCRVHFDQFYLRRCQRSLRNRSFRRIR